MFLCGVQDLMTTSVISLVGRFLDIAMTPALISMGADLASGLGLLLVIPTTPPCP